MSKRGRAAAQRGRQAAWMPRQAPISPGQAPSLPPASIGVPEPASEVPGPIPGSPEWLALVNAHHEEASRQRVRPAPVNGIPLAHRAAALRVPLAQVLAALSQIEAELQGKISQVDLSDHPNAQKLFASLAEAKSAFAVWYFRMGVALAAVAPGEEGK